MNPEKLCVAYANREGFPPQVVTAQGQLFMANRSLMESMVEAMRKMHPNVRFVIEEVDDA